MNVAVVVLAVLAALLGGVVLALSLRLRRAGQKLSESEAALDEARATIEARDGEVAAANAREGEAERRADAAEATVAAMEDERTVLDARATEVVAERDRLAAEVDQLTSEHAAATEELSTLGAQVAELEERAERFRDDHRSSLDATALWHLELARAERTWRHSVAVSPDQASPFADTDDPLGTAVAIEVAALREEVGVAMELQWEAAVDDPARRLLVLRLVQELLSLASRAEQAVVLTATDAADGAIELHLGAPEDHEPIEAVHLDGVEHLITVDTSDGVRVIVH